MDALDDVDAATLLSGRVDWAGPELASRLAHHPLDAIDTEYPHYVGSVDGPEDVPRPSEDHPVFYGCFDWHSAVHSHWALVRQLRLFEDHPDRETVLERIDARLTPERVAAEVDYFEANPGFERPYGWVWLLHLDAELGRWDGGPADDWRATLRPLTDRIRELVEADYLPPARPARVGTHGNTAFALTCLLDYARATGDADLETSVVDAATDCFGTDRDYPVRYEPLGWDFLSPGLAEADLLRRVYDRERFAAWLDRFLPAVTEAPHDAVLDPVAVDADEDGGLALHFVGLNVSRAWCLAGIADALGDGHRYVEPFRASAARHAAAGLDAAFTDDYAGSHWLSSFVLYLLTRREGGIAPH